MEAALPCGRAKMAIGNYSCNRRVIASDQVPFSHEIGAGRQAGGGGVEYGRVQKNSPKSFAVTQPNDACCTPADDSRVEGTACALCSYRPGNSRSIARLIADSEFTSPVIEDFGKSSFGTDPAPTFLYSSTCREIYSEAVF